MREIRTLIVGPADSFICIAFERSSIELTVDTVADIETSELITRLKLQSGPHRGNVPCPGYNRDIRTSIVTLAGFSAACSAGRTLRSQNAGMTIATPVERTSAMLSDSRGCTFHRRNLARPLFTRRSAGVPGGM